MSQSALAFAVGDLSTRTYCDEQNQEPMSRSMQLHYISVTAFLETDLFLDRIPLE